MMNTMNNQQQQQQQQQGNDNNQRRSPQQALDLQRQQIEQLAPQQKVQVVNRALREFFVRSWSPDHVTLLKVEDQLADKKTEDTLARFSLASLLVSGAAYVYLTKPARYGEGQFYSPIAGGFSRMLQRVRPFNPPIHPAYGFVVFAATYMFHVMGPLKKDGGEEWMRNTASLLTPRSYEIRKKIKELDPERASSYSMEVLEYDQGREQTTLEQQTTSSNVSSSSYQQQQHNSSSYYSTSSGQSSLDHYFDHNDSLDNEQRRAEDFSERRRGRRRTTRREQQTTEYDREYENREGEGY